MKICTERAITLSKPVLDDLGESVKEKRKWGGREVAAVQHDHERHPAGAVIEVDDDLGKDLIRRKLARKPDDALDEELSDEELERQTDPNVV